MVKDQKGYNFQDAEQQVKAKWAEGKYFEQLVEKNKEGERFKFLDGPITANNAMGIHHAFGRTLKDITIKYNSMKGKSCHFQNGFDAQGLWVEVEVEKQFGFKDKTDILKYGMEEFTDACLDRVQKYAGVISDQSVDLGQWMDWGNSYFTNTDENILGIWHFLKKCDDKGWLVKKNRVMSWCPRCGTSLSEHEMSGNYKLMTHQSVYFKLPLEDEEADLLVWTTTPWTLTANAAVAVHPELNYAYVQVKSSHRPLICCEDSVKRVAKSDFASVLKVVKGSELQGKTYTATFPELEVQQFNHKIIPWKEIVADEGTGLVHIAPGCGEEDYELGKIHDVPAICPIDESGYILPGFGLFSGQTTVEVAGDVFSTLEENKKLYKVEDYEHKYPTCWRCKTPIVFKLVDEWYIKSDEIRPQLLEAVETVEWQPKHVKKRMIDWLHNMSDWNISRKRFYGLPLPIYHCDQCGKTHVIGSKEELAERSSVEAVENLKKIHRPWIDDIKITCDCGNEVSRIPEVGDCWLDAGIAPFVTKGYFEDKDFWRENYPSEVVIEMIEQVRLWFYSMLFMSVTLEGVAPYKKVVAYGSVVREDGEKFSKSAGKDKNILLNDAINELGADTIRYLYAGTSSINDLRFGYSLGDESKRKLMAFWNTYTFFDIYSNIDKPTLDGYKPKWDQLANSDKWLVARVEAFIEAADKQYKTHSYAPVLKGFEQLVDDMNNWYIRVNRKRFWKGESESQLNAYWTLYTAIKKISQVMAPIIPFMTDFIWHDMVRKFEPGSDQSVHLSGYASGFEMDSDHKMLKLVPMAREVISVAQKLRNDAGIMVKQPLSRLLMVVDESTKEGVKAFEEEIKSEINVTKLEFLETLAPYLTVKLGVNFRQAGMVFKQGVNDFKAYIEGLDAPESESLLDALKDKEEVYIDGFDQPVTSMMLSMETVAKAGYAYSEMNSQGFLLDTHVTPDLRNAYLVRALIRKLQVLRKDSGLNLTDHINLWLSSDHEEVTRAISEEKNLFRTELLADDFLVGETPEKGEVLTLDQMQVTCYFEISK